MRQNHLFVPARLALAILAILLMAVSSPKASVEIILASSIVQEPKIDPIVTGQTISSDQMEEWKAKRARYKKCGLCGQQQPFPGDLKD